MYPNPSEKVRGGTRISLVEKEEDRAEKEGITRINSGARKNQTKTDRTDKVDLIAELKSRIDKAGIWKKEIALNRGDLLKTEGTSDNHLYYIEEGSLRIYIHDGDDEPTIRFGYAGDFIASLDSFITEKPSEYIIEALKKTRVRSIGKSAYMNFIRSSTANRELWEKLLLLLLQMHIEREKDILINSPQKRYERVLKRSPRLFREIPLKYIASYLRMTPETLSRLRSGKN